VLEWDPGNRATRLVWQWVDDVFELAGPNVLVNGIEYAEAMKDREGWLDEGSNRRDWN
jgi:hypothetical protein